MAHLKSAYKKSAEEIPPDIAIGPNIPAVEINGVPTEPDAAISTEPLAASNSEPLTAAAPVPDATNAMRLQIEALRRSAEMQQRYGAQAQLVNAWRRSGVSEPEIEFLLAHPGFVQNRKAAQKALNEVVGAGHERNTPEFFTALESAFSNHMQDKQERKAAKAASEPVPEFFQPPPTPEQDEPGDEPRESIYSAPVSREVPTGGYREPSLNSVRLSIEEKQIASASGISEVEYAKQKLRMLKAQATGELQK
jgi:hypothetical protein